MGDFYENLRDVVAAPIIKQYGMALTLRRIVKGAYSPNAGTRAANTSTDHPCFGLQTEYKENMIAASVVLRGDKRLLLSAHGLDVEPQIGDQFIFPNGDIWYIPESNTGSTTSRFQPIEVIAPSGTPVIYQIQVRR